MGGRTLTHWPFILYKTIRTQTLAHYLWVSPPYLCLLFFSTSPPPHRTLARFHGAPSKSAHPWLCISLYNEVEESNASHETIQRISNHQDHIGSTYPQKAQKDFPQHQFLCLLHIYLLCKTTTIKKLKRHHSPSSMKEKREPLLYTMHYSKAKKAIV